MRTRSTIFFGAFFGAFVFAFFFDMSGSMGILPNMGQQIGRLRDSRDSGRGFGVRLGILFSSSADVTKQPGCFLDQSLRDSHSGLPIHGWWAVQGSNLRPPACKARLTRVFTATPIQPIRAEFPAAKYYHTGSNPLCFSMRLRCVRVTLGRLSSRGGFPAGLQRCSIGPTQSTRVIPLKFLGL
jgi:hypothetical protein